MREELRWRNGVRIKELKESDTLVVETLHHTYEITVLEPSKAEVLVSGGDLFPVPRPASVSCASVLSSFLKLDGIYVGLRMKIRMDGSYVVTSRVRRIGVIPSLAEALPVASSGVLRTCEPSGPRALTPRRTLSEPSTPFLTILQSARVEQPAQVT